MICPSCGKEVDDMRFCSECGYDTKKKSRSRISTEENLPSMGNSFASKMKDQLRSELDAEMNASREKLSLFKSNANSNRAEPAPAEFKDVHTRDIQVKVEILDRVNFCLVHNGIPLVQKLIITNTSEQTGEDVLLKIWVAPDYSQKWSKTLPSISAGETIELIKINLPFYYERMQRIREAEKAHLRITMEADSKIVHEETHPLEVMAYNEWYAGANIIGTLASFVMPNHPAIERFLKLVHHKIEQLTGSSSLHGYQGSSNDVLNMVKSIYLVLQEDLKISYINPPGSFEATGQKILTPAEVIKFNHGTCLDLSVLFASIMERIGLNPLIFLIHGHAFLGVWLKNSSFQDAACDNWQEVERNIKDQNMLAFNSTTFTGEDSFENCCQIGSSLLKDESIFTTAVDISSARRHGIKPLPLYS